MRHCSLCFSLTTRTTTITEKIAIRLLFVAPTVKKAFPPTSFVPRIFDIPELHNMAMPMAELSFV
jgi:hypothetical protein